MQTFYLIIYNISCVKLTNCVIQNCISLLDLKALFVFVDVKAGPFWETGVQIVYVALDPVKHSSFANIIFL